MPFLKNAWYAAGWSADIGREPIMRRLLDEPILLYRSEAGKVIALNDMCPHRFAPLHKGKLIGDAIECPYHGLRFDGSGACVLNPHGSGKVPPGAGVPSYPIVERHGAAWIWMGDPSLADPAKVPDCDLFGDSETADYPRVQDSLTMKIDYRLLIDNLLDLTHANYLHPDTLTPGEAKRESAFSTTDTSVLCNYAMRGVKTPSSQRLFFPEDEGDYYSDVEWLMPSVLRIQLFMTGLGQPKDGGSVTRTAHLITPETEKSCHYMWVTTRNRLVENAQVDAGIKAIVNKAFLVEDEPMISAVQDYMAGREFFALQPLYLETDASGARARRMLEKAIRDEQNALRGLAPTPDIPDDMDVPIPRAGTVQPRWVQAAGGNA